MRSTAAMSLRSQGYRPHMVKMDDAETVIVCDGLNLLRDYLARVKFYFEELTEYQREQVAALEILYAGDSNGYSVDAMIAVAADVREVAIPSVLELAGFAPRVRTDFWGNVLP